MKGAEQRPHYCSGQRESSPAAWCISPSPSYCSLPVFVPLPPLVLWSFLPLLFSQPGPSCFSSSSQLWCFLAGKVLIASRSDYCSWPILVVSHSSPSIFLSRSPIHPPFAEGIQKTCSGKCLIFEILYWWCTDLPVLACGSKCFSPYGKLPFFCIYLSWVGPWSWVTEVERSVVILV